MNDVQNLTERFRRIAEGAIAALESGKHGLKRKNDGIFLAPWETCNRKDRASLFYQSKSGIVDSDGRESVYYIVDSGFLERAYVGITGLTYAQASHELTTMGRSAVKQAFDLNDEELTYLLKKRSSARTNQEIYNGLAKGIWALEYRTLH